MDKFVMVDEVGLNATLFASLPKAKAVDKMIAEGLAKDKAWAEKAYELITKKD